jgi:hypothetical protein
MTGTNSQIKTGSYAVTTVYSMPWTKKENTTVKTVKKRVEKKVVHEIFEKCSELTDDEYWVSVFKSCAREKFPRGFQYKNGMLIHRKGSKTIRVLIPDSVSEALSASISFFKSAGGLMSVTDKKKLQKEEENRLLEQTSSEEITWKDIKIERIKEVLISEFISDLSIKNGLDENQKKELSTVIKVGFILKCFGSKNIIMDKGKIIEIQGLTRSETKFTIDPVLLKSIGRKVKGLGIESSHIKTKTSPIILWEKYLDNLEKKRNTKGSNFNIIDNSDLDETCSPYDPTFSMSPSGDSN